MKERGMNSFVCGALSGMTARSVVAPMDRVKIRMQTGSLTGHQNLTLKSSFLNIVKTDGIRGLWKGNSVNCLRVAPHSAIQFGVYNHLKSDSTSIQSKLFNGSIAGICAASVTQPLDVIRVQLQTSTDNNIKSSISSILKHNGLRGLYRGYIPTICSLSPFIAINFTAYDTLKSYNTSESKFSFVLLGGISGLVAQSICFPLDTIRRRMQIQTNKSSLIDSVKKIYSENGIKSFYRGITPNSLKIVPNNSIRFGMFEYLKNIQKEFSY